MDIGNLTDSLKKTYALSTDGPEIDTGALEIQMVDTFIIDATEGQTYIVYNDVDDRLEFYVYGQLKLYIPCTAVGNDVYLMEDGTDLSVYDSTGKIFSWVDGAKIIFSGELKILDDMDNILYVF